MPTLNNFLNIPISPGAIMDSMAIHIQREASQSSTIRRAGGGAIVIEFVPAAKSQDDPPRPGCVTVDKIKEWLGLRLGLSPGSIAVGRAYDLLPSHSRYVTEDGEIIDCESVAHGKIATLKRIRLSNPEEYMSFAATDLPGGPDCGYAAYKGAVVFIIRNEYGDNLLDIYISVSGSPYDDEDRILALGVRAILEKSLVEQLGCQLVGAQMPEPIQE